LYLGAMSTNRQRWRRPLLEAALISLFILVVYYYWFAVANRYAIFLYGHTADGIPPAQPFDATTSSRYWMAGLVVAGAFAAGALRQGMLNPPAPSSS
ncbi:MAG TPA: hypothetical protein PKZ99_14885, partial [Azospirillaceae bacterium]|nr:hypothetical protein [Azospirillaceae bacterium]